MSNDNKHLLFTLTPRFLPEKLGAVSNEQGKRFHQDIMCRTSHLSTAPTASVR